MYNTVPIFSGNQANKDDERSADIDPELAAEILRLEEPVEDNKVNKNVLFLLLFQMKIVYIYIFFSFSNFRFTLDLIKPTTKFVGNS